MSSNSLKISLSSLVSSTWDQNDYYFGENIHDKEETWTNGAM